MTKTERVVAHFFHRDFERCRIMDKHLQVGGGPAYQGRWPPGAGQLHGGHAAA